MGKVWDEVDARLYDKISISQTVQIHFPNCFNGNLKIEF